jgi:hypothetical protein
MHWHECNTHWTNLFISENQTKDFSYTIFPVKKHKCGKIFKIMRKLLFNYSFYSHPEIGNFRVWQRGARGLSARHRGPSAQHTRTVRNFVQPKLKTTTDRNERRARTRRTPDEHVQRGSSARTTRTVREARTGQKNSPTSKVNSPKSSSDFPNGWSCGDKGLGAWKVSHKDAIAQKSCLLTP